MTALELIAAVLASNMPDAAKLETVQRLAGSEPQHFPVYIPYTVPTYPTWPAPYQPFPITTWGSDGDGTGYSIPQHNSGGGVTVRLIQ